MRQEFPSLIIRTEMGRVAERGLLPFRTDVILVAVFTGKRANVPAFTLVDSRESCEKTSGTTDSGTW